MAGTVNPGVSQPPAVLNSFLCLLLATGVLVMAFASSGSAQVAPTSTPNPPTANKSADDSVVMNPFEVSMGTDEGYAARETIAGTRFKSNLKDVPSQVSVMTKEFLDDIASVTVEDAFRYSANVENGAEYSSPTAGGGDFNAGVLNTRNSNRIRGLTSPGVTHDFFQTNLFQDTYNTERASISSGPNAILFGNGNPGGIVDTSYIRANLQRPRYSVSFRNDNYQSFRTALDLNQPLLPNRAGIRVAYLNSRQNLWKEPAGRDDDRIFGTFTVKPFKTTAIRFYYEDAMVDQTPLRTTRFGDQVTPWIAAGRPVFNNGLTGTTLIDNTNNGIFVRNTSALNILFLGATGGVSPYGPYGAAATTVISNAATRYTVNTIGPGSTPLQTGTDSYIYSLPNNNNISPIAIDVNGNGTRNLMYAKVWGASFEQDLTHNFFLQIDYNRERIKNPLSDFLRGIQSAVRADANQFLPDRITPNPNLGRYYVEGGPRVFSFRGEKEETRVMLSYEHDFTTNKGWSRWLGRHRLATMYQRAESMEQQQESVPKLVAAGLPFATALDTYTSLPNFSFRSYLNDPQKKNGSTYSVSLPFDPVRDTTYLLPDGSTYYAGIKNPFGATNAATLTNNLSEGKVLAMQNFFLKDRLVTSFGWRRDNVRQANYTTPRKTASATSAFVSIQDVPQPRNWSVFTAGNTKSLGAVAHVFPWISVFYNQSSTFNPPTGLHNPDDGTQVAGSSGEGKDYGLTFSLLRNRLTLRVDKYENSSGPDSNTGFRNAIVPVVQNIENTLIDRTADGTVNVPRPQFYDAEKATYADSTLVADLVSKGYEVELIANPTPNWRLVINGSKGISTSSNIGKEWINFIRLRSPIYAANANLTGPNNDTTTIGTRYLGIIQTLNQMAQADGQRVEDGRDYRANLVSRYGFTEGFLKASFVGTGYSWRSKQAVGYKAVLVDNAFKLPGSPDQIAVPALNSPIYGKAMNALEIFFGYSHRIGRQVNWKIQLNIRNLLDDETVAAQRGNITTGQISVYSVTEPRSFILTNTFTF